MGDVVLVDVKPTVLALLLMPMTWVIIEPGKFSVVKWLGGTRVNPEFSLKLW